MPKSRSNKESEAKENRPLKDRGIFKPTGFHIPLAFVANRDVQTGEPKSSLLHSNQEQKDAGFEIFTRGVESSDANESKTLKHLGKKTFDAASKRMQKKKKDKVDHR